ncbi:MAG: PfkB family carbohydrate kinase [Thermoguttaceae bacterium]
MSLLIVGSVAYDNILTPSDRRDNVLGGAGTYAAYAASFFTTAQLVGVVGDDFPTNDLEMLREHNIDISGVEVRQGEKTFRWTGRYLENMNDRETLETQLNVLGTDPAKIPDSFARAQYVLLGNAPPAVQSHILDQIKGADLVIADTMNLWIEIDRDGLSQLMKRIDGLVLNEGEARQLTGESNLITAGRKILGQGPRFVVIKKGEHGAIFQSQHETYVLPAFPTEQVVDPTGAGDTFAGGMLGYIASRGTVDSTTIKTGIAYGTIIGSCTVGGFGLENLQKLSREKLDQQLDLFRKMVEF